MARSAYSRSVSHASAFRVIAFTWSSVRSAVESNPYSRRRDRTLHFHSWTRLRLKTHQASVLK